MDAPKLMTGTEILAAIWAWAWVVLLSGLGGLVSFIQKLKSGAIKRFSFGELVGEMVIAFFVGILTFLFCEWGGFPRILTAGLVGLCAHMGSRALFVAETLLSRKTAKWLGVESIDPPAAGMAPPEAKP